MSDVDGTTLCDLDKHRENALSRRELAWELLKQTRNPVYVAMRYGYPVEKMRAALEKIPDEKPMFKRLSERKAGANSADDGRQNFTRPGDLLPETLDGARVPGEDDDKE